MRINIDFFKSANCYKVCVLFFLGVWSNSVSSQISAPNANYRTVTQYSSSFVQDSIYVFCDNIGVGVGELRADAPDGTPSWTFTWTKWEVGTGDFTPPVTVETNQSFSILTNLTDGRYRVVMSKSGETDVSSVVWVLNSINSDPALNLDQLDCEGVHFTASFTPIDLEYNDIDDLPNKKSVIPKNSDKIVKYSLLRGNIEILSATEIIKLPPFSSVTKKFIDQEAYDDEKTYELVVTDQYGCEFISDALLSKTYVVKSDFSVDPVTGEAPLEVSFTNNSINATDYRWYIYQDFDRIVDAAISVEDSLLLDGVAIDEDLGPYTYSHPGNYLVKLIVSSNKGPEICIDEFVLNTPIVVDTSLVQVPNVFTPNGDGMNDVFKVKSQSLKSFHASIFNRWGRVVYEWKDPDGGWNGKINGKWATPGTYFYVITAMGREEEKKKYTKKGSFMLIRK